MKQDETLILDMDNREVKRRLMSSIGTLRGVWEVTFKKRTNTRSLTANSYYWAAVVKPFADWLEDEWGESVNTEQAHEMLKEKIVGSKDSHGIMIPPTTRRMSVESFSEYIEKCIEWLAQFCHIEVLPSELYFAIEGKRGKKNGIKNRQEQ